MYVNEAKIVESEIFVYNLGTMFYINKVLFADKNSLPSPKEQTLCENSATTQMTTAKTDVERIPEELAEDNGTLPDVLLEEDENQSTKPSITMATKAEQEEIVTDAEVKTELFEQEPLENTEAYKMQSTKPH